MTQKYVIIYHDQKIRHNFLKYFQEVFTGGRLKTDYTPGVFSSTSFNTFLLKLNR